MGGTLGGISGVLGRVTGVLGDTTAKLTMDDEFVARRKQGSGGVGQGLEGAAKVGSVYHSSHTQAHRTAVVVLLFFSFF